MNYANDKERLHAAFENLNKQGIEAKENFWCCQSCAGAALENGGPYVFWHQQSHESAFGGHECQCWCECYEDEDTEEFIYCDLCEWGCSCGAEDEQDYIGENGLYLYYGTADGEGAAEVGNTVKAELEKHGLKVEWNGESNRAIVALSGD